MKARIQAGAQIDALILTAPEQVRAPLRKLTSKQRIRACAALRPGPLADSAAAVKTALRALARRWQALQAEIDDLDAQLAPAGHHRSPLLPLPQETRSRLRGARTGTAQPPRLPDPLTVTRRVSVRGTIMTGGQRIQVGLAHARKTAEVTVEADTYQITVEPGITITAPRTTSRDITRHKASNYD
jgi:hypothetical protein